MDFHNYFLLQMITQDQQNEIKINYHFAHARNMEGKKM